MSRNTAQSTAASHAPCSAFLDAVRRGNTNRVRRLLEDGIDPNARNEDEDTALHILPIGKAALSKALETAALLLEHGADPNVEYYGEPALHRAIFVHSPEMLRLLIAHGADLHRTDKSGFNPLHTATIHEKEAAVAALLECGADPLAPAPDSGFSSFHLVCMTGHPGILELHLARVGDPDAPTPDGRTGLWYACRRVAESPREPNLECVGLLLAAGADPRRTIPGRPSPHELLARRLSAHQLLDLLNAADVPSPSRSPETDHDQFKPRTE